MFANAYRQYRPYLHNTAWIMGEKQHQGQPLMHHLAEQGWVCFASNYRLSPRASFPDQIVDVKRALAWVRGNAETYGGDPDFICITGGSAGGHLCALAALSANDPSYQPGFEQQDTSLAAISVFLSEAHYADATGSADPAPAKAFTDRAAALARGLLQRIDR